MDLCRTVAEATRASENGQHVSKETTLLFSGVAVHLHPNGTYDLEETCGG